MLEHLGSAPVISCEEFDRCLAVLVDVASSSVLDHVPDPGPELRDPRIHSRTVSKIRKVKKH